MIELAELRNANCGIVTEGTPLNAFQPPSHQSRLLPGRRNGVVIAVRNQTVGGRITRSWNVTNEFVLNARLGEPEDPEPPALQATSN